MPATLKTEPTDHARNNAAAWNDSIVQMVAALESWEACETDADAARQRIEESALSVEVRSDWASASAGDGDALTPSEFRIVLTTGGPGCQIRGELDDNGEPRRAWLEYQGWGTPWTQYYDADADALLAFASCFFGE